VAHQLTAVQVNWRPWWKYTVKLRSLCTTICDTARVGAYPRAFCLVAGAGHHMRTKGQDRSFLCLKNLVPFILLMDSLNSHDKSICFFLPQISRHLFIYWDFLFSLGAADFQVICTRQRFNSSCQAEQQQALRNPALPGSSSPQSSAAKEALHHTHPDPAAHPSLPKWQLLVCPDERGETRCLAFLPDTECYSMQKSLVCMGTSPMKHSENATSPPLDGGTKLLHPHLCCLPWFGLGGFPALPYSYSEREEQVWGKPQSFIYPSLNTQATAPAQEASLQLVQHPSSRLTN